MRARFRLSWWCNLVNNGWTGPRLAAIQVVQQRLTHSGSAAKADAKNKDWLVCPSHSAQTVETWQIVPTHFRFGLISATNHRNCCGEFPNSLYVSGGRIATSYYLRPSLTTRLFEISLRCIFHFVGELHVYQLVQPLFFVSRIVRFPAHRGCFRSVTGHTLNHDCGSEGEISQVDTAGIG